MSVPTTQSLNSIDLEQGKVTKNYSIDEGFEALKDIINEPFKPLSDLKEHKGMLTVKTGNQWIKEAKNRPIPKMLFGELFHESELCILFADTNLG